MCEFQELYLNDDGFVILCKDCGHYQVCYGSTMLTFTKEDFKTFCKIVKDKSLEKTVCANAKCIIIPTPYTGVGILLTKKEAMGFYAMLDKSDTEEKALLLISMFNL